MNEWGKKKNLFKIVDVRGLNKNFFPGLPKTAKKVNHGEGICVIQTFDPKPLYFSLKPLGFEHSTDKISDDEYRAYFYRAKAKK